MSESSDQNQGIYEAKAETRTDDVAFVKSWLEAIELSSKEEEEWRKTASEAVSVYSADKDGTEGTRFNLYHANIETIVPAVYNSTPVPDIRRRHGDRDPVAKMGADVIERMLTYSMDYCDFDSVIARAIYHLAIAGRGIVRVAYESTMGDSGLKDGSGQPVEDVSSQSVTFRLVPWAGFRRGPGRTWDDVPWVAFAHYMTREELLQLGPAGANVTLDRMTDDRSDRAQAAAKDDKPEGDIYMRAMVWEIWDRPKRQVVFLAPSMIERPVAVIPDPLRLEDFYPIPRPMMTLSGNDTMVPLCPYGVYRQLLGEIDRVTVRIGALIAQLRPRALGPQGVDMDAWATAKDGEVVTITDVGAFMANGGMDKLLAWFPMEPTIKAIESLYQHREALKQSLFEVSGVADIMRGQSNANETLGAQQIKTNWGSLRIQRAQADVQRFIRDLLRIAGEIVAEHFTPVQIAAISGINAQDPNEMMLFQQSLSLIKNDRMRGYKIDIETDSTIKGDVTRNMESMAQFVGGSANFFASFGPAVEAGFPMEALVTIYSAFARNFKLGKQVDDILDKLPEMIAMQQQNKSDPAAEKAKVEIDTAKAKAGIEIEKAKMGLQAEQAKMQLGAQKAQQDMAVGQMKHQQMMQQAVERQMIGGTAN